MSFAKRELERWQDMHDTATQIALRGKAIIECQYHEGICMDHHQHEDAYRLANGIFSQGDYMVSGFPTRRALTDAVQAAIQESGFECGLCGKIASRLT